MHVLEPKQLDLTWSNRVSDVRTYVRMYAHIMHAVTLYT